MSTRSERIIVIGGGIAGLASAALLARDGHRVTLLEARGELGGRAGTWERRGFRFDTGPSWYLMPEVFDHFFRMLGTSAAEQLDLVRLDPGYRVYAEGYEAPVDVRASRAQNVALFESVEPGAGARLERYLDSAASTYDIARRRFLYTNFDDLRALAAPDVLGGAGRLVRLLTTPLDRFAARAVQDRRLRQVLGYPAVFLGSSPSATPAMYHLMSHMDLEQGVLYPRGGFGMVIARIAAIAESAGVEVITNAEVEAIDLTADAVPSVTGVRYIDARGATHRATADRVVSAADLHHTETDLLPRRAQTYPESWWERRTSGPGAVLALLGIRGEVPGLAHHTLFFTEDWASNFEHIFGHDPRIPDPASFYACTPSASDSTVAPPGDTNLFLLIPVPADTSIGRGGEDGTGDRLVEEAADRAIARIAAASGSADLQRRIVVRRTVGPADFAEDLHSWRGGALGPAHTLRQSAFLRGTNRSRRVHGLFTAWVERAGHRVADVPDQRGERAEAGAGRSLERPAPGTGRRGAHVRTRPEPRMTGLAYLAGLLLSIGAMALIDARWRLAFRRAPGASAMAVGAGTALLLVWDLAGIGFGVFFRGDSPWSTGLLLAPELPVEEPVFLVFLCYLALVAVLGTERVLERRSGGRGRNAAHPTDAASNAGGGHP